MCNSKQELEERNFIKNEMNSLFIKFLNVFDLRTTDYKKEEEELYLQETKNGLDKVKKFRDRFSKGSRFRLFVLSNIQPFTVHYAWWFITVFFIFCIERFLNSCLKGKVHFVSEYDWTWYLKADTIYTIGFETLSKRGYGPWHFHFYFNIDYTKELSEIDVDWVKNYLMTDPVGKILMCIILINTILLIYLIFKTTPIIRFSVYTYCVIAVILSIYYIIGLIVLFRNRANPEMTVFYVNPGYFRLIRWWTPEELGSTYDFCLRWLEGEVKERYLENVTVPTEFYNGLRQEILKNSHNSEEVINNFNNKANVFLQKIDFGYKPWLVLNTIVTIFLVRGALYVIIGYINYMIGNG